MGKINRKPGVMLYFDRLPALEMLTDEQRGKLLLGMIRYANGGPDPAEELDLLTKMLWISMKPGVDLDDEKYNKKVENARRSVEKRAQKRKLIQDLLAESGAFTTEMRRNLQRIAEPDEDEDEDENEELEPEEDAKPETLQNRKTDAWEEKKPVDFEDMRRQRIRMLEESGL